MLPFIAGVAAGAVAVIAFNNKKEIKQKVVETTSKAKDTASDIGKKLKKTAEHIRSKEDANVEQKE